MSEQQVGGQPLLEVTGLECSYGRLQVLFGVSVTVPDGGRVALLGTNGAGKSTLLRTIAGLLEPHAGTVRFDGHDLRGLSPDERVGLGMTLVEGGRATFPSLTVEDHDRQLELCKEIVARGLSVHATEALLKQQAPAEKEANGERESTPSFKTAHVQGLEDELRQKLATRVSIKLKAKDKGQVVIGFDSTDDFERIVETFRKAA